MFTIFLKSVDWYDNFVSRDKETVIGEKSPYLMLTHFLFKFITELDITETSEEWSKFWIEHIKHNTKLFLLMKEYDAIDQRIQNEFKRFSPDYGFFVESKTVPNRIRMYAKEDMELLKKELHKKGFEILKWEYEEWNKEFSNMQCHFQVYDKSYDLTIACSVPMEFSSQSSTELVKISTYLYKGKDQIA